MKPSPARKPPIRIAVVESDPLRVIGWSALFDSEPDLELHAVMGVMWFAGGWCYLSSLAPRTTAVLHASRRSR